MARVPAAEVSVTSTLESKLTIPDDKVLIMPKGSDCLVSATFRIQCYNHGKADNRMAHGYENECRRIMAQATDTGVGAPQVWLYFGSVKNKYIQ